MSTLERIPDATPDQREELLARLRAVAPEIFSDGQLDLDRLAELAGDEVATGPERYGLNWPGKREAISMLQAPSNATLAPDREASVNFDAAKHVFIEGENLEVLKLLYKSYFGRVKLIYIDPPYNTQNDFIYHDDFSDPLAAYLRQTGQMTEDGDLTTSAPEKAGRLHSNWLSMMYPRLSMARQMLKDDGLIFVSIDDIEIHNMRGLLNEIFGEENFIAQMAWRKAYGGGAKAKYIVSHHEYVLVYAREKVKISRVDLPPNPETRKYYKFKDEKYDKLGPYRTQPLSTNSMDERKNLRYPIPFEGDEVWPEKQWQWEKSRALAALASNSLEFVRSNQGVSVYYKQYLYDEEGDERASKLFSVLDGPYTQSGTDEVEAIFGNGKVFPFPKPSGLIKKLLSVSWKNDEAIVIDFFGGSGSTAQAVLDFNSEIEGSRINYILVQFPQNVSPESEAGKLGFNNIAEIARARIRKYLEIKGISKEGFRAFRLGETNLKRWTGIENKTPEGYLKQMDAFADTLLPGWKAEDVIWEVALREGFALTAAVEAVGELGHKIWRVRDDEQGKAFTICLADHVELETIKALALTKADLFVCRDTALNDTIAANLALQCTLKVL